MSRRRNPPDDFQSRVRKKRGHWMYPFAKVKQESGEGWYIDWLERSEGIPIEEVEVGDPVADWSLNETVYWTVRDVDVDHGRIWLDPAGKNPFLTGVGAGGAKLGDWDWKALTGEAHKEAVDRNLRWIEAGCVTRYDDFTKLLKGIVATEFGPNGAQGGWYNAHDSACVGRRQGMTDSEIVAWDAHALQRIGLEAPEAALRGEVDSAVWTDFVNTDPATCVRFVLEHPVVSIKLRNCAALNELWRPYYRHIVERATAPKRWDDPAWVANHERIQKDVEERWKAGEYVRHEIEPMIRRLASQMAELRHERCEAFAGDPYWIVKEKAINLAGHEGWTEVLRAHEKDFDFTNRKYVILAWERLGDVDAIRRMESVETHPEPLKTALYALKKLAKADVNAIADASPDRYERVLARTNEKSEFGYHARELRDYLDNQRRRRASGWDMNPARRNDPIEKDRLLRAIDEVCDPEEDHIDCYGEDCALFAVALNRVLGGRDQDRVFLGSYNTAMEKKYGSCMYFHVALLYRGELFDGSGIVSRDSLLRTVETEHGGTAALRLTDGIDAIEGTDASRFGSQLEAEIERIADLLRARLGR
jgi:hypothetical protein